jgi:C1A family cysteine protease
MTNTTPRGHGLGMVPDEVDNRDFTYDVIEGLTSYEFVDLAKHDAMPPVWNQGPLGSCTAHGTLCCFLWASAVAGVNDPMLSRLQLYYNTRVIEGTVSEDSGAQIRDAIKATTKGIAPETDWPYDTSKFAETPPQTAVKDAKDNLALEYRRVHKTTSAIQSCLSEGYPVDIGVTLYESFESEEALFSGYVPMPSDGEQVLGGHCMAIVGIGTGNDWHKDGQFLKANLNATKKYVKVRNSWGTDVYEKGYLLMPVEYVTGHLGRDYWTIRKVS